ncbi:MAG: phosphoribosylanthranilate isomerase [Deltaproteobacteria bacterium]|nr:phosphoribosylanthranilate isomerase [Deltaproteobacteria bacterium]
MRLFVKICGVRRLEDLEACVTLAVDAIGLNLVPSSPRACDEALATALATAVADRARIVWVVAAAPPAFLAELIRAFPRSLVQRCDPSWPWPPALGADRRVEVVRLQAHEDVAAAEKVPGTFLLSDAAGALGGSGRRADWPLTRALAEKRRVLLAGGLTADNVAEAVRAVSPFGVDVAGGVEARPGEKDPAKLRAFVAAARAAHG